MPLPRPMLDDLELQQVQQIEVDGDQVLVQHGVPALEGDFLQRLGRRGTQISLTGVLTGSEAGEGLGNLREKFRAAEPVDFVADIATAVRVDTVLIEEMRVRELAGKPERFEYAFILREYTPAPAPEIEPPPPPPEPRETSLIVEVIVEGQPGYDYSQATVTVNGDQDDGVAVRDRRLTNRRNNVWTEEDFPPGDYTVRAEAPDPVVEGTAMVDEAEAEILEGEHEEVTITLSPGQRRNIALAYVVHYWFDKAFIEPCMRPVLRAVAERAARGGGENLLIVGHTDLVGSDEYNRALSERRARGVHAYLTFGNDADAAVAEWNELRKTRAVGVATTLNDTWGVREYQYMLQAISYYIGPINERHDDNTDQAVRAFQQDRGLAVDGVVGDETWPVLIRDYLALDSLSLDDDIFVQNTRNGCDGGPLRWIGCGEKDPVKNTQDAWRPNRRTEILFVRTKQVPGEAPRPVTWDIRPDGSTTPQWCLGPGNARQPCPFLSRTTEQMDAWLVQSARPERILVRGRITYDDGVTPYANQRYALIAPDGEYLHKCRCPDCSRREDCADQPDGTEQADLGEYSSPGDPNRGRPIYGRTDADGRFSHPEPTPVGTHILEVPDLVAPAVARAASEQPQAAKGNVVCKQLRDQVDFDVIICSGTASFELTVNGATRIAKAGSETYLATRDATQDVIISVTFPPESCTATEAIRWTGGQEVPGEPLRRRVPRSTVGETTVTATAPATGQTESVNIFVIRVTLDVDANRSGSVEEDESGKNTWEYGAGQKGAVILCNNDDDNSDDTIDNQNVMIDGANDLADLAPLIIRQSGALPTGVSLVLSTTNQNMIRIFDQRSLAGSAVIGPAPLPGDFAILSSDNADIEFGMEATQYPDSVFDGLIQLTLSLREGHTEITRDEVVVRVAPWLMPSHMDETIELYVVETGDNAVFVSEIESIASAVGIPLTKTNNSDRWMQDAMEIGYSRMPGTENNVVFKALRERGLGTFPRTELLGPDFGFVEVSTPTGANTFDSHGNLEVSPPVKFKGTGGAHYQLGRIYFGRGRPTEPFNVEVEQFLAAQRIQKPFKIDTDWLAVGHVDEILSFIPSSSGDKNFRMLFADTSEAIRILTELNAAGHGDLILFEGRSEAESVGDLLDRLSRTNVGELGWANDYCQDRLDVVREKMRTELDLADSDIIAIPALFTENPRSPRRVDSTALPEFDALIPGMVNLLLVNQPSFSNTRLVLAKPFGPVLGGVDQLEQDVRSKLAALGYLAGQIHFVDDYDTYHLLLGEVHCGTNSRRQPPATPWWEQTDF